MSEVQGYVTTLLIEKPEYYDFLKRIVDFEKENAHLWTTDWHGFEYWQIYRMSPARMKHLIHNGIVKVTFKSSAYTHYRIVDLKATEEALEEWDRITSPVQPNEDEEVFSDEDLFDCIVGFEEAKALVNMSIKSEKPVHILFVGPPASSKSLFLMELSRLKGSVYSLGHSTSKSGLTDFIFTHKPKYLMIDELDKMNTEDFSTLLSVMETGILSEIKYKRVRNEQVDLKVYAACNNIRKIPPELQSRFLKLYFPIYTEEGFYETAEGVLTSREGTDPEVARYIAEKVWKSLKLRDVRETVRIARLCTTKEEVDDVVRSMKKYGKCVLYN